MCSFSIRTVGNGFRPFKASLVDSPPERNLSGQSVLLNPSALVQQSRGGDTSAESTVYRRVLVTAFIIGPVAIIIAGCTIRLSKKVCKRYDDLHCSHRNYRDPYLRNR